MDLLVSLTVAVPLVVAALIAAVGTHIPRLLPDVLATAAAAAVTGMAAALMVGSSDGLVVSWFGGWQPEHGVALGIAFVVDPLASAVATLAGLVTTAGLVFAWRSFEEVRHLFHSLMLTFLAGMVGFALSGDLFNLVVFFELMSVSGYALCGYHVTQPSVLQGSVNFAILNSIGTFCLLMAVALLYGTTGELNLAAIGEDLSAGAPPGLLVAALTLLAAGFLVKAGVVPFHFWLADAYAVATAPLGAVFTAVMSELGLHALARVYYAVFPGALSIDAQTAVRAALVGLGVLSAVVGAVMCLLQADTKRQLAFFTVSAGGATLAGLTSLTAAGIAGATMYVVAAGTLRGAVFLAVGMILARFGSSDELWLRGRGRGSANRLLGALLALCGLGLAALPPFGVFTALSLLYDGMTAAGYGWLPPVIAASTAVCAGTVLRLTARVFFGWGSPRDPLLTSNPPDDSDEDQPDSGQRDGPGRLVPLLPALALAVVGFGISFVPGLAAHAIDAADGLLHHSEHLAEVLTGAHPPPQPLPDYQPSTSAWIYGAASTGGALLVAAAGLWWRRLVPAERSERWRPLLAPVDALKALHSGSVGDYLTWLLAGTAALAVVWALSFS